MPRIGEGIAGGWITPGSGAAFAIVAVTCETAADIAELTGARARRAASQRIGGSAVPFVTFDIRRAQPARTIGLTVLPS